MSKLLMAGMMFLLAATAACGSNSKGDAGTGTGAKPFISRDASPDPDPVPPTPDAAGILPSDDALAPAEAGPLAVPSADAWIDPALLFPTCTGTPEQINDCIINLPARGGMQITRPDPMDYELCK